MSVLSVLFVLSPTPYQWVVERFLSDVEQSTHAISSLVELKGRYAALHRLPEYLEIWEKQGGDAVIRFLGICNAQPTRPLAKEFIRRTLQGEFPEWMLSHLTPKSMMKAAEQDLGNWNAGQGLAVLSGLMAKGLITRAEAADCIGSQFNTITIPAKDQAEAVQLAEGPLTSATSMPSPAETTSEDVWIRERALHRLDLLAERVERVFGGNANPNETLDGLTAEALKRIAEQRQP